MGTVACVLGSSPSRRRRRRRRVRRLPAAQQASLTLPTTLPPLPRPMQCSTARCLCCHRWAAPLPPHRFRRSARAAAAAVAPAAASLQPAPAASHTPATTDDCSHSSHDPCSAKQQVSGAFRWVALFPTPPPTTRRPELLLASLTCPLPPPPPLFTLAPMHPDVAVRCC